MLELKCFSEVLESYSITNFLELWDTTIKWQAQTLSKFRVTKPILNFYIIIGVCVYYLFIFDNYCILRLNTHQKIKNQFLFPGYCILTFRSFAKSGGRCTSS